MISLIASPSSVARTARPGSDPWDRGARAHARRAPLAREQLVRDRHRLAVLRAGTGDVLLQHKQIADVAVDQRDLAARAELARLHVGEPPADLQRLADQPQRRRDVAPGLVDVAAL